MFFRIYVKLYSCIALNHNGDLMGKNLTGDNSKICSPQGNEHSIQLSEFFQKLNVDENGLSDQEAATLAQRMWSQCSLKKQEKRA